MMDENVHTTESWLPHCVSDDENEGIDDRAHAQSLHVKNGPITSAVNVTYTQLTNVNTCQSSINSSAAILSTTKHVTDVITLGDHGSSVKESAHLKRLRPHSTPATLLWLEQNFEMAEGVCIPRSTLYMYYVDFCQRNTMQPVNAASFGKIIRQQFPHLTTRRLGTRGQSRYHYYGIAVRDTSQYYDVTYSKKGGGCTNGHEHKKEQIKHIAPNSQRSKIGNILPDFSYFRELKMPSNMSEEKVSTFLMMYRTHCQRLIDAVMRASFDEVQSFLLHFWKGIPSHISSILGSNAVINMIGVCDSFVYKAISTVLFPTIHQALPESLTQMVRQFARDLTLWLRVALDDVNVTLRDLKIDLAKCFSRTLRRQTSLNHLCQASRVVLHTPDIAIQMLQDWKNVDLDGISRQILYTMDGQGHTGATIELITNLYREFETILEDQAPIEACMEWLESLIERCVVQPSRKCRAHNANNSLRRSARQFLLMWSSFGSRVIRDMTLHSAPSFGSFHLLHLTFDDYVLFLVESIHWEERTQQLFANIPNDAPPTLGDHLLDESVVDPTVGITKLKWFNSAQQHHQGNDVNESMLSMPISPSSSSSSSHHSQTSNDVIIRHHSPAQPHCAGATITSGVNADVIRDDESEVPEENETLLETQNNYGQQHYDNTAGYHFGPGGNQDTRGSYNYGPHQSAPSPINNHKKYSPCHSHNNQYMAPPAPNSSINSQSNGSSRPNNDLLNNGVEYLNFGQYSTSNVRRGDYSDCHVGYVYEQQASPAGVASSAPPVIYSSTAANSGANCFYAPPPPPTYNGDNGTGSVCCPPQGAVTAASSSTAFQPRYQMEGSPKERHHIQQQHLVTMVDIKIQPEDIPQAGYTVTSLGNGRH